MTKYEWLKLREIETLIDVKLEKDDLFLFGRAVVDQKNVKKVGQQITYYKVIREETENKMIEYVQVFDVLEEN